MSRLDPRHKIGQKVLITWFNQGEESGAQGVLVSVTTKPNGEEWLNLDWGYSVLNGPDVQIEEPYPRVRSHA